MGIFYIIFIKLMLWYVYMIASTLALKFLAQFIRRKLIEAGEEDTGKVKYFTIMLIFANFFISGYITLLLVFN